MFYFNTFHRGRTLGEWVKAMIYSETPDIFWTRGQNHIYTLEKTNKIEHIPSNFFFSEKNVGALKNLYGLHIYSYIALSSLYKQIYISKMETELSDDDLIFGREQY